MTLTLSMILSTYIKFLFFSNVRTTLIKKGKRRDVEIYTTLLNKSVLLFCQIFKVLTKNHISSITSLYTIYWEKRKEICGMAV